MRTTTTDLPIAAEALGDEASVAGTPGEPVERRVEAPLNSMKAIWKPAATCSWM